MHDVGPHVSLDRGVSVVDEPVRQAGPGVITHTPTVMAAAPPASASPPSPRSMPARDFYESARRASARFAAAAVPRNAKNATTTADGTLVELPSLLMLRMFDPKMPSNSTANQIVLMASAPHMWGTSRRSYQCFAAAQLDVDRRVRPQVLIRVRARAPSRANHGLAGGLVVIEDHRHRPVRLAGLATTQVNSRTCG